MINGFYLPDANSLLRYFDAAEGKLPPIFGQ